MPSLIRFLVIIGIFIGAIYGAMYAIVVYVEPEQREMSQRVPPEKLNPQRIIEPETKAPDQDETEADE